MATPLTQENRPNWPKRAVVTAGMPYGNKGLHFGHIGGVFVPADFYARFLRDRLGRKNVLFVSGTDCYGSPIMEGHRKAVEQQGYTGDIASYVAENHQSQKEDLQSFDISCIYCGSALGAQADERGRSISQPGSRAYAHEQMTAQVISRLFELGLLEKRSTKQFYDPKAQQFLNGRQVIGRCPIQGCKSEKAYADECDLGHQFESEELIAPVSALTGETPELKPVDNLYFDLPAFLDYLKEHTKELAEDPRSRSVVATTMEEWLLPAQLHIQMKFREAFDAIADTLPTHTITEPEGNKTSFVVTFPSWKERDDSHEILNSNGIRFRSGKALVPFRITGNVPWGVPVPPECGEGLTCWVWPESLWAPISFTRWWLARNYFAIALSSGSKEAQETMAYASPDWKDWWCSPDSHVYQFIGQDNIYFYGIAQSALWKALDWNMEQSTIAASYHLLYMGKKASSSSETPPPLAHELLDYYTPEQLRAHWISLGLGEKPVSFSPKAFDTRETGKNEDGTPLCACDDPRVIDPVLKEGAMLTGVFNRLARSCFYGVAQKDGDTSSYRTGCIPAGNPSEDVVRECKQAVLAFEKAMYTFELHHALSICDELLRNANKRWSDASKAAKNADDDAMMTQALVDAFHALHVGTVLMHGIVPEGCGKICKHFDIDFNIFFSWDHIFDTCDELVKAAGEKPGEHAVKPLPPRTDFFERHPSQL